MGSQALQYYTNSSPDIPPEFCCLAYFHSKEAKSCESIRSVLAPSGLLELLGRTVQLELSLFPGQVLESLTLVQTRVRSVLEPYTSVAQDLQKPQKKILSLVETTSILVEAL